MWNRDGESEDDINITYREETDAEEFQSPTSIAQEPTGNTVQHEVIDSDDSDNIPLARTFKDKNPPRKIYPSEIHFTLFDKTTKLEKNVAQKSLA